MSNPNPPPNPTRKLDSTLAAARRIAFLASAIALGSPSLAAADKGGGHVMLTPAEISWGDAPPILPAGAKLAVLYGDPGKDGLYVVRLKMPAGYKIPAHWHPVDENVTVISGAFAMGMGDRLDPARTKAYPSGSFVVMAAKTNHFALAKGETVVEVTGMGPFTLTYVNAGDDPTRAAR